MVSIKNIFKRDAKPEKKVEQLGAVVPVSKKVDFKKTLNNQFSGVNWRDSGALPLLPKLFICLFTTVATFLMSWFAVVSSMSSELEEKQQQELLLRQELTEKSGKAANLDPLKKQRRQAEEYVVQLEKQLPTKSEMDALLSDINQVGTSRNLQFETFRPAEEKIQDYYVQVPVVIRVSGKFADIAAFSVDVAQMSRIVTLNDLNITENKGADGGLVMDATVNMYRYLEKNDTKTKNNKQNGGTP